MDETERHAQLRELYEAWRSSDASERPWAHAWRDKLPDLRDRLVGSTVEDLRVVSGSWDDFGSRELELKLRTADGHELKLYVSVSAMDDRGVVESWDETWSQEQADSGIALQLTLFEEDFKFEDIEDINVPTQDPWFEND